LFVSIEQLFSRNEELAVYVRYPFAQRHGLVCARPKRHRSRSRILSIMGVWLRCATLRGQHEGRTGPSGRCWTVPGTRPSIEMHRRGCRGMTRNVSGMVRNHRKSRLVRGYSGPAELRMGGRHSHSWPVAEPSAFQGLISESMTLRPNDKTPCTAVLPPKYLKAPPARPSSGIRIGAAGPVRAPMAAPASPKAVAPAHPPASSATACAVCSPIVPC